MWIIQIINNLLTRQHIGIILTVLGTILLAFSVKIIEQKGEGLAVIDGKEGKPMKLVGGYINRKLFWVGLGFIAIGSALQW